MPSNLSERRDGCPDTGQQPSAVRPHSSTVEAIWKAMARVCFEHQHVLSEREMAFVRDVMVQEREPSLAQVAWLTKIDAKVQDWRCP